MLAKNTRLNLSVEENSQMFDSSQRFFTNDLLFYYRPNKTSLKIAALAPIRLFSKASQRNEKRRLIYNLINEIAKELNKTKKLDLLKIKLDLIIVYKSKKAEEEIIKKDLDLFFKKVLKDNETL